MAAASSQWVVDLSLHMGGIRSPMPPGVVLMGAYVPEIGSLVTVSRSGMGGSARLDLESHAREAEREMSELLGLAAESRGADDGPEGLSVTRADIGLAPLLLNGLAASALPAFLGLLGVLEGLLPVQLAVGGSLCGGAAWMAFRAVEWRRSIDRSLREVRLRFRHFSSASGGPASLDSQFMDSRDGGPAMLVRALPLELPGAGGSGS